MAAIDWYKLGNGDRAALSPTLETAQIRERTIWAPTKSMISMLFGERTASTRGLSIAAYRLSKGLPILCDTCQRPIWPCGDSDLPKENFGHDSIKCAILINHTKTMSRIDTGELISSVKF